MNMADHRNVGNAVLDAVRDAANRWLFTDIESPAWSGVKRVAVAGSPYPTHAVDITDTLDTSVRSLRAHARYLESLGEHPMSDPEEFLPAIALQVGARYGNRPAAAFEVIDV